VFPLHKSSHRVELELGGVKTVKRLKLVIDVKRFKNFLKLVVKFF
jgi:hypothetical protein